MKITKRQLRRIIKEEKRKILKEQGIPGIEGPVRDLWGSMEDQSAKYLADDYDHWVKENGHVTPAASSVMATYFLENGLEADHEQHKMLGVTFGVAHEDVMRDIKRQQSESLAMAEGTALDSMPDSWRQILGNCLEKTK
jgi:hypothetical protein